MMAAALLVAQSVAAPSPAMLSAYVRRLAQTELAPHHIAVQSVRSAAEWAKLQKRYLDSYRLALGPFPRRTPLNAKVNGRIERPDFTIDKVVFESRPRFYVTGNLYVPRAPGRHATVLLLSGHYELGKAAPDSVHQLLATTLARSGVVVFAIDPLGQGEREFQLDKDEKLLESCATEHCYLGFPCLLTGTNLIQYMVWDAMRAVDYLIGRPEVDPKRIAVTGISGGGTQTFSLMPLDHRLAMAAPTCFVTSRIAFLGQPADAEQCLFGAISNGLDHGVMIALCAPRAYQVQATRGDLFPIQGVRDSAALAKHIYEVQGAGDRFRLVEDDGGHAYTEKLREAFYSLLGLKGVVERPFEPLHPKDLDCTPTGQVKTSYRDARWVTDLNRERAAVLARHRPRNVREEILKVLGPVVSTSVPRASVQASEPNREVVWLESEPGITVTVTVYSPHPVILSEAKDLAPHVPSPSAGIGVLRFAQDDERPVPGQGAMRLVLLLDDSGAHRDTEFRLAAHAEMERARAGLLAKGCAVAILDVRGTGGRPPKSIWDLMFGPEAVASQDLMMCGTSLFAGRVRDVLQCVAYLRTRDDIGPVSVAGWGQGGLAALSAAALDTHVSRVAAVGSLASYRLLCQSYGFAHPPSTVVWNVLAHYDLPDVAAVIAPRPVFVARPVDAMMKPLPDAQAKRTYEECRAPSFTLAPDVGNLLDWLTR